MQHSVVVEHVTVHQLRDTVGIGKEESDPNNLGDERHFNGQR